MTGDSIEGLDVSAQWKRVDAIARRFRWNTDDRPSRRRRVAPSTRDDEDDDEQYPQGYVPGEDDW